MRLALINPPVKSIVCELGVGGYQMPTHLLMVAGPLLDAGHEVTLVDAAREGMTERQVAEAVGELRAEVVMLGHVGSTMAHPTCVRTFEAIREAQPQVVTVYGGVFPTFQWREVLTRHSCVDVIVRGEGEVTAAALVAALECGNGRRLSQTLCEVRGVAYRHEGCAVSNPLRAPTANLDAHRIAWELIDDWDKYQALGLGRSAVVQFSRGCPHACTYCGQWQFWRRWRHRNVGSFVDELEWLHRERGVRHFWLADENPTTDRAVWKRLLRELAGRDLDVTLCGSARTDDLARDADLMPLLRKAGFLYMLIGVETVSDEVLRRLRKSGTTDDAQRAVRLLRKHGILSIVDYILGLEDESPATLWRAVRGLHRYDGDFANALFLTPLPWTVLGRSLSATPVVEPDQSKWDFRHQVVDTKRLSMGQLFLGARLVEVLFHLHPRRLWRVLATRDRRVRRQLRYAYVHTTAVFACEVVEFAARQLRSRLRPYARRLTRLLEACKGSATPQPQQAIPHMGMYGRSSQ